LKQNSRQQKEASILTDRIAEILTAHAVEITQRTMQGLFITNEMEMTHARQSKYAIEHCTPLEIKAVSQNIGHDNVLTTLTSYAYLPENKRRETTQRIGTASNELAHVPSALLTQEMHRRMK